MADRVILDSMQASVSSWWCEGIRMKKGLLAYLFGGMLVSAGVGEIGVVVILLGVLSHWKYWLAGILAFCVGVTWT